MDTGIARIHGYLDIIRAPSARMCCVHQQPPFFQLNEPRIQQMRAKAGLIISLRRMHRTHDKWA
eukprot:1158319-Pelagomonas_calceolata.AAC.1